MFVGPLIVPPSVLNWTVTWLDEYLKDYSNQNAVIRLGQCGSGCGKTSYKAIRGEISVYPGAQ